MLGSVVVPHSLLLRVGARAGREGILCRSAIHFGRHQDRAHGDGLPRSPRLGRARTLHVVVLGSVQVGRGINAAQLVHGHGARAAAVEARPGVSRQQVRSVEVAAKGRVANANAWSTSTRSVGARFNGHAVARRSHRRLSAAIDLYMKIFAKLAGGVAPVMRVDAGV